MGKIKTLRNSIRQRGLCVPMRVWEVDAGMRIKIEENKSKLGKRYIAKMYRDGKLIATYPADKITDIDLSYFTT